MTTPDPGAHIRQLALDCGIPALGITSVDPLPEHGAALRRWLAAGNHGDMQWMEDTAELREHPASVMPDTKSVLVALWPHHPPKEDIPPDHGRIAAYSYGRDYHKACKKRLIALCRRIEDQWPNTATRAFVDTGPMLERSLALRAGLGFIGRNRALISPDFGSYCFIGVVLTSLDLATDTPPVSQDCGDCRRCVEACPTGALTDRDFDARRCISYLTIEHRGVIDAPLADLMGDRLFGCDTCQRVCPHNRGIDTKAEDWCDTGLYSLNIETVLGWEDDRQVTEALAGTAIRRPKRSGLVRNACVAAANRQLTNTLVLLQNLADTDKDEVVRLQARQALGRFKKTP